MTIETQDERHAQAKRIERILIGMLGGPEKFRVAFVYSDEEISFRIDDANGHIMCESYRGTSANEIKAMTDDAIAKRLDEMFANTHRLLEAS